MGLTRLFRRQHKTTVREQYSDPGSEKRWKDYWKDIFYVCDKLGVERPVSSTEIAPHLYMVFRALLDRIETLEALR